MHAFTATVVALLLLEACGGTRPSPASPNESDPRSTSASALAIRSVASRPPLLVVPREGDPRPALGIAVAVAGGPVVAEALAAVVEARLSAAHLGVVDAQADRAGYRVRVLLAGNSSLPKVLAAAEQAMLTPVDASSGEARLAAARVATLRQTPLDDDALLPFARCSGEPGLAPSEPMPDAASMASGTQLEAWRREAHGTGGVAFAVVGTQSLTAHAEEALHGLSPWPAASTAREPTQAVADTSAAYASNALPSGIARLSAAFWVSDREAAMAAADELGDARGPLVARLGALPAPFRLRKVVASVGRTGACLALEAESELARGAAPAGVEEAAGTAGVLLRHEVTRLLSARTNDPTIATRHLRALGDPREAAAAAAWWALSAPGIPGTTASHLALGTTPSTTLATRAGVAATEASPNSASAGDASIRFARAIERAQAAWSFPPLEARTAVESGQGEIWMLLASSCSLGEGARDAGTTALAMTASALRAEGREGVRVEPWVAPDGAGLLAHATYADRSEQPTALATRVAEVLGRAFGGEPPPANDVLDARSLVLGRLEQRRERARGEIADQLFPGRAGALFPWGLLDPVARASADAVRFRWSRLGSGPLRVAVLANDGGEQAKAAVAALERWATRPNEPRSCPPLAANAPMGTGLHTVAVPAGGDTTTGHAFVVVMADAGGPDARLSLAATVTAMNGANGWLARALAGTPARAEAWQAGRAPTAVLVVEVHGADDALEPAISQTKALFARLAQGAAFDPDLERVRGVDAAVEFGRLDPRQRVLDLWRSEALVETSLTLASWRAWLSAAFRDDAKTAVVVERPAP